MAEHFKNLASTQLDGGIGPSATTITVDSAMGFTSGNFRIRIDDEIMIVTAVNGLEFTVTRHAEGTTATAHNDNAVVRHVLTVGALDDHDQNDLVIHDASANKPAAGVPGRFFLPTDAVFLEHDDGTAWRKYGPIWPVTPPRVADFPTWVNRGASTAIDNKGAIFFSSAAVSGTSIRAIVKPYPTPPFTVEMAFIPAQQVATSTNEIVAGLCIRNSSDEKLQVYGTNAGSTNCARGVGLNYTNPTTAASGITGWLDSGAYYQFLQSLIWIKYQDDATNRIISMSADGYYWLEMISLARTNHTTPDQIGLVVSNALAGTETNNGCTFLHWKEYQ